MILLVNSNGPSRRPRGTPGCGNESAVSSYRTGGSVASDTLKLMHDRTIAARIERARYIRTPIVMVVAAAPGPSLRPRCLRLNHLATSSPRRRIAVRGKRETFLTYPRLQTTSLNFARALAFCSTAPVLGAMGQR